MSGRAFITGVSGFAGQALARLLVEQDWTVAGTVGSRECDVPEVEAHRVQIDDCDRLTGLLAEFAPDVVFHLAAIVDTVQTPSVMELHRVNTLGTTAVTLAVANASPDARLVFASSAFAYGHVDSRADSIHEDTPLRPVTPYGASKAAGETLVLQHARLHSADAVITRAFQHTGRGHVGAYALADWAAQLTMIERSGEDDEIATGDLSVKRDYLDVRDVASAYLAVAEHGASGGVYNVCSGVAVSMRELLETLVGCFDVNVKIVTDPSRLRKVDQPVFVGDPAKLTADTGWRRRYELAETMTALAEFSRGRDISR